MATLTLTEQRLTRVWQRYTQGSGSAEQFWNLNEHLWDMAVLLRDCGGSPWAVELFAEASQIAMARAVYAKQLEMEVAA